ncbi:hypothetical protein KEM54_000101 [Ascosphaera aggregata]|nr:hypothetical protein KEM54_000101 [Ascosphaera aggregata]
MRLNAPLTSVILSSLALASANEESKTAEVEKPTFTPTSIKAPFLEQFTDDWDSRWTPSHAKKEDSKSEEDWQYVGEWSVEEPTVFPGIKGDKGLVVKNVAAHHAISAKFPKPIDNKGKTLVVQYEVKMQNSLSCEGAYLKLLKENAALHAEEFSNASPYVIMFGPDRCGSTNKVHFIFKHRNPKTGDYEEKHLINAPAARINTLSTLYTLVVRPDQTFEILIDGVSTKNGTLLQDFLPAVNPPKEIDDPNDSKPEDWVDEPRIPDPEAEKPADWDEDAPFEIPDEEAEQPEDWLEHEPTMIPDPEAEKPEDWDDEEDGDWIAPSVPNPKCGEVSGCGPWERPMIENPAYKGKWSAPLIENPAYKGPWAPRKIANPDFFEDLTPSNFEPMGGIGFEIWTMQNNILFDNIYVGHSVEDAKKLQAETFDIKRPVEEKLQEESRPTPKDIPGTKIIESFKKDPVGYIKQQTDLFLHIAKVDFVEACKMVPEIAGGIFALFVTLIALIFGAVSLSKPAAASTPQVKKEEKKGEEKVEEKKKKKKEGEKTEAKASDADAPSAAKTETKGN